MAISITITPKELERQAATCFIGLEYKIFLAYDPTASKGVGDTVSQWETIELESANGYMPVVGTIASGSYNSTAGRYDLPTINAQFTGTGAGYQFDTLLIAIENATHLHSLIRFSEPITLQSGVSRSFLVKLIQDD